MMVRTFFLAFIIFDNRIIDDFNIRVPLTNTRIKNWRTSEVKKKKKKKKLDKLRTFAPTPPKTFMLISK